MKFKIEDKIFEDFDKPFIGVIIVRGMNDNRHNPDVTDQLRNAERKLRDGIGDADIREHPHIVPWREAYRKFGAKPSDYRCSSEALSRVVLKGNEIRDVNNLVNLYNLISIKYILPVGAEDLDKMQGDLVLGLASGDEEYTPLNGEENDPPKAGEVIYKDDLGVICRRWNWREGDRTKITEQTKDAIVVIESLAPIPEDLAKRATDELAELIKKYCGGEIKTFTLNSDNREISVDTERP